MNTNEYPPRHIQGFRPLVPGEAWHRNDFTPDMLPEGWRPLLMGEKTEAIDELPLNASRTGDWRTLNTSYGPALERDVHFRTRRPLPPPPPTFEYDGKTWNSHVPGDPCPVIEGLKIEVLICYIETYSQSPLITTGDKWNWTSDPINQIIGYRIPDAEPQEVMSCSACGAARSQMLVVPQDDPAKLRERIAELEQQLAAWETELGAVMFPDFKDWHQNAKSEWPVVARSVIESLRKSEAQAWEQLATALTPRPIAEAGPVKEGFVRLYGADCRLRWVFDTTKEDTDTHFLDIRLPEPDPRAEYARAVAEAGGAFEAWLKAKGGVK